MTDGDPAKGKMWNYRFSKPDETVMETGEFNNDDAAEGRGRDLSKSNDSPIVVQRHSAHVEGWEYVTEVDERP